MKLFIGTGAERLKVEGYTTIDIEPYNAPDIVANAADLSMIDSGSCTEIYCSHVLEHFAWPQAILVVAEWTRVLRQGENGGVLKLAVPDMQLLCGMLARGQNPAHVMSSIYGAVWEPHPAQRHKWGYTPSMLWELMTVLGFTNITWWNSGIPDAANGWIWSDNGRQLGVSLNLNGTRAREPYIEPRRLFEAAALRPHLSLMETVHELGGQTPVSVRDGALEAELLQRMHFRFLTASRRIAELEEQVAALRETTAQASAQNPETRRFGFAKSRH